jgi:hypothetical protein
MSCPAAPDVRTGNDDIFLVRRAIVYLARRLRSPPDENDVLSEFGGEVAALQQRPDCVVSIVGSAEAGEHVCP